MSTSEPGLNRWERAKLGVFAVRHTLGVAVFVWLTLQTRRLAEGYAWTLVAALGLAYMIFAIVAWTRLRDMYRHRRRS